MGIVWKISRKWDGEGAGVPTVRGQAGPPLLERLLHEIRSGGTLEVSALAARLDTSPAMVQAMLEHLERLDIIQAYSDACGESCRGCSLNMACDLNNRSEKTRLWKYS